MGREEGERRKNDVSGFVLGAGLEKKGVCRRWFFPARTALSTETLCSDGSALYLHCPISSH